MADDLRDLLTETEQQNAIRAATKRKAVEEALLKPSMLKMLDELVTDLGKEQPEDTGEEVAKASRVSGGWAKPDDPIYKQGWTIAPVMSGRRRKR